MRLSGRPPRGKHWWLAIGVLASMLLLCSLSHAAPAPPSSGGVSNSEIEPATVIPEQGRKLPDNREFAELMTRIHKNHDLNPHLRFGTYARKWQTALSRYSPRRLRDRARKGMLKTRVHILHALHTVRTRTAHKLHAARQRLAHLPQDIRQSRVRWQERQKKRKFGPRAGEEEVRPVFRMSPHELETMPMPKHDWPQYTGEAKAQANAHITPWMDEARLSWQNAIPMTREEAEALVAAQTRARQPKTLESLGFELEDDGRGLNSHAESSQWSVRTNGQASETESLEDVSANRRQHDEAAAGPSHQVRTSSLKNVEVIAPRALRGGLVPVRLPSSRWEAAFKAFKKAKQEAGQRVQLVAKDIDQDLAHVRLRKRSPAHRTDGEFNYITTHSYPGQFYRVHRLADGRMAFNYYDPINVYHGYNFDSKYWHEMDTREQEMVKKAIPNFEKGRANNWRLADTYLRPVTSTTDTSAASTHYIKGRGPGSLEVYSNGREEWRYKYVPHNSAEYSAWDRLQGRSGKVKKEDLPAHVQRFVDQVLADEPLRRVSWSHIRKRSFSDSLDGLAANTLQKRAGSGGAKPSSISLGIFTYPGQQAVIYPLQPRVGVYVTGPNVPAAEQSLQEFHQLSPQTKKVLQKMFPGIDEVARGEKTATQAELVEPFRRMREVCGQLVNNDNPFRRDFDLKAGEGPSAEANRMVSKKQYLPGRGYESIRVLRIERSGGLFRHSPTYVFSRLDDKGRFIDQSKFSTLPNHLKQWFMQAHPEIVAEAAPRWFQKLRIGRFGLRKRSSSSDGLARSLLNPTGGTSSSERVRTWYYPGEDIIVVRPPRGHYLIQAPSVELLQNDGIALTLYDKLETEAKSRVDRSIPQLRAFLNGDMTAEQAGFHFKDDAQMSGFPTLRRTEVTMGPESIHMERVHVAGEDRIVFKRYSPTSYLGEFTFAQLPAHIKLWLKKFQPGAYAEAVRKAVKLRKRNGPKAVELHYPGAEVLVQKDEHGGFLFSVPAASRPERMSPFMSFHELDPAARSTVKTAIPNIQGALDNPGSERSLRLHFRRYGDYPNVLIHRAPIRGQHEETIIATKSGAVGRYLGRKPSFTFSRASASAPERFADLPEHLQDWIQTTKPDIFKEVTRRAF